MASPADGAGASATSENLSECCRGSGLFNADAIKRAITRAEQGGEGLYHAELIRLRGELLLRKAEDCFHRANELARAQGALFWELRIATSLARLRINQGRHDEARRILAPVYDRFGEGFATIDLRAAKTLLDTLR